MKLFSVGSAVVLVASFALFPVGCSSSSGAGGGSGGQVGTGGTAAGSGGSASGGQTGTGGVSTGGSSAGTGGATGGSGTGGASTGGAASGTGGGATGGVAATGGAVGTGGTAAGGGQNQDGGGTDVAAATGGGGGSGTGGASPDGGVTFNPCPAAGTNCKIMPLGDSITFGSHSTAPGGGYRVELFKQSLMNSKKITFVGRNANGPTSVTVNGVTTTFPQGHEGYSGYTIDSDAAISRTGISTIVDAALSAAKPHIVLLMIGTNDVNNNIDLANAPTRLGNLLDRITSMVPNALLVVAKITPTMTDANNTKVQTYNNAIPGVVQSRTAAGKHIIMVDMYAAISANANYKTAWMYDDLHPNDAGYAVLGQTWYAGIKNYLP